MRCQRSPRSSLSASTTLRAQATGTSRETPACVQPSRSADNRSPFGTANATVTSGASGAAAARDATSTRTSPERVRPSVSRAAAIVP